MSTVRRSRFLAGALGLVLSAAGSGANAQSAVAKLRVGTLADDTFAGAYFAQDMGFFDKAGLTVDVQTLATSSAISAAMVGAALDIGAANPITLANAVARDVPFVMIAPGGLSTAKAPSIVLVVAQNSPVRVAKDLEGKTVAVPGIRALADGLVNVWLLKNGADPAKVLRVEMRGSSMAAGIEHGTVTAAMINEPATSAALKTGNFRVIANPALLIAPQILSSAWYTTSTFLQQSPDVVKRFQNAIATAQHWANSHPDESAPILAKYAKSDVETIRGTVRCSFADQLRVSDIQPELNMAFKFGIIPKPLKASDLIIRSS